MLNDAKNSSKSSLCQYIDIFTKGLLTQLSNDFKSSLNVHNYTPYKTIWDANN